MNQIVYLVRHCQATGQEPDAPLTEIGKQQAIALADWLSEVPIERIISSPFSRALQSITLLSERLGLAVEADERLVERMLSPVPLDDWRESLAKTFIDLDLSFEGGESSRTAMMRGVAVVHQAIQQTTHPVVIVTHGNLMTLILKHFDEQIGYAEWERLQNPDVYCIEFRSKGDGVERVERVPLPAV
ncbi:histidine phosphatase family protein [Leptolyngbya sp. NIES-2104]|uniref:histidine phosphatase family protein n=1 Tax=Leptolyngbya sp. NIES-2104 TaxID=1552121 RepID=UPI0006ECB238|nr:histidine phosphatase family protein [Leptolyngbya sp. NIES-2104]GAP97839.1 phosphoglycerate mutase family 2 [Leptolyngbya sp. NIES-2104]